MKVGERVRHYQYGVGVVERISMLGVLEVRFGGSVKHTLAVNVTSLDAEIEAKKRRDEEQRARDVTARNARIQRQIEECLARGDFAAADALYERAGASFWERTSYEAERTRVALQLKAEYQRNRRAAVCELLDSWKFDEADEIHRAECSDWWAESDYRRLRNQASSVQQLVGAYAEKPLRELDDIYRRTCSHIPPEDYAYLKLPKLQTRLARLAMPLTEEQLRACARPERHRLIRARAGSGKTRTLAALAALSIHDESLCPDQVLVLAFNNQAAKEIGERIREAATIDSFRNARTFHSLAWRLADHSGRDLIFDDGNLSPSRRKQSGFMERLIESIMNPAFRETLYEFFRRELEQLDRLGSGLSKEEYVAFRRSLTDYTLGGESVKSNGEKFIADFLFEHDIKYKYEKVWSWDKQNRLRGAAYRPDFSIADGGRDLILEHWALNPDDPLARLPDWWDISTGEYREQIEAKREFWTSRGVVLLETHAQMLNWGREAFEKSLKDLLEHSGVVCRKLAHDDLVQRVAEAPRTVSRMAGLFLQFVSRAKKRGWTMGDVTRHLRESPDPEPRNRAFHKLALHAYTAYERGLRESDAMDFDDLLIAARESVERDGGAARIHLEKSKSIAVRDLRWILIDEFQDFSELYFRLIAEILRANPEVRVVAVGDDWQAINGFAGAQSSFFNRFHEYFQDAGTANITTNRRSGKLIVDAGNRLMADEGSPASAFNDFAGQVDVVAVDKIWPNDDSIYVKVATRNSEGRRRPNWDLAKALMVCVEYIAASVYTDANGARWIPPVLLVSRTGHAYGVTLADFSERLSQVLRECPDLRNLANKFEVGERSRDADRSTVVVQVMTAHKAKGKEADTVIVLEATRPQFPKVHADNQLFGPFGVTPTDVLAEERRLFYVATSRAEYRLLLLTETGNESPFIAGWSGTPGPVPREPERKRLSDDAVALQNHLKRIDQESLVRRNVSQEAAFAWEQLAGLNLGLPEVGFFLDRDLYAELAWPSNDPRVAILTGRQKGHAYRWRSMGWRVY